jgi:site-specific recombinase XerD
MAGSVTFLLKEPNAEKETPIYMMYYYGKEVEIKISTGEKIDPKFWDKSNRKAKVTQRFSEGKNLNTRLRNHRENVLMIANQHIGKNHKLIVDILKREIKQAIAPDPVREPVKMTFIKCIEECITGTNRAPRTKLSYGTTLGILKKYEGYIKRELSFEDINMAFYDDFQRYCENVKRVENDVTFYGYAKNTFGDHIKKVKVFMGYALDRGYTTCRGHLNPKFKAVEETPETIYLNDDELENLYKKDLSKNTKLDRVRDLFLIACRTGLRYSDLSQLTSEKFIDDGALLQVKTIKTGELVVIPLHWTVREIMDKYNGKPPRSLSNQKMNVYLKELGEVAGINDKITVTKTKGALSTEKALPKYELMTVHTARRSFATNMYLAKFPPISIMKITGHKTERAFMKYIKITQKQNADFLKNDPYFLKPLSIVSSQ